MFLTRALVMLRFVFYRKRTRGFQSRMQRADHFKKHRKRLGIPPGFVYEVLYERIADDFISSPLNSSSDEFTRQRNADLVRFDRVRDLLGIKNGMAFIKSYYRPDPAIHKYPTNWDYYLREKANA